MSNIHTTLFDYINESNRNKIVYHGSPIAGLQKLVPRTNKVYSIPPSIFLTNKKKVAKNYGNNIYKCVLSYTNPLVIDVENASFHEYHRFEKEIYSAYDDGHDCVIFRNIMDSQEPGDIVPISDVYVVFSSDSVNII